MALRGILTLLAFSPLAGAAVQCTVYSNQKTSGAVGGG